MDAEQAGGFMKELPIRKHPRLSSHDYSSNGSYFITFCVKDMHEMLGQVVVGRNALGAPFVQLSGYGILVHAEIKNTYLYYRGIQVDNFVVMPNHVHMIVTLQQDGAPGASRPTSALIPNVIGALKRKTNKAFGFNMWQTSYHDHIIRGEAEYQRMWQYIDQNPATWAQDRYYIK